MLWKEKDKGFHGTRWRNWPLHRPAAMPRGKERNAVDRLIKMFMP
jgi:hypothetical protein